MQAHKLSVALFLTSLFLAACNSPAVTATDTSRPEPSSAVSTTAAATATPQPTATPTVAVLDLEIVEWFEHNIPNLADPSISDTQIEVLVRNPNDFPVSVNTGELEFRLINAAGEVVYTNSAAYFSLWQGTWMLAGESTGFQICACFESSGGETQEWEAIELSVPVEPANVVYTTDIEASLGEPISLAEAHLGGNGIGIPITLTNTSDQPLESIPMRVIARDTNGRYIGMVAFGNSVASFTEVIYIQPGDSAQGILASEINYFNGPLTYEVVAIGIPASAQATQEVILPSGSPLDEWEGVPVMPDAINGEDIGGGYQFTTQASADEITAFYEAELAELGYQLSNTDAQAEYTTLYFAKESARVLITIVRLANISGVLITQ